jgi:hypothetical protein
MMMMMLNMIMMVVVVLLIVTDTSQQCLIFNVYSYQEPNASGTTFESTSQGSVSAMVFIPVVGNYKSTALNIHTTFRENLSTGSNLIGEHL